MLDDFLKGFGSEDDSSEDIVESIMQYKQKISAILDEKVEKLRADGKTDDEIVKSFSDFFFKGRPVSSRDLATHFGIGLWSPVQMINFMGIGAENHVKFDNKKGFIVLDDDGNEINSWVLRKFGKTSIYYLNSDGYLVPEYRIKSDSDLMRFELLEDVVAYMILFNGKIEESLLKYKDDMITIDSNA